MICTSLQQVKVAGYAPEALGGLEKAFLLWYTKAGEGPFNYSDYQTVIA